MKAVLLKVLIALKVYKYAIKFDEYFKDKKLNRNFSKHGLEALIQADKAFRSVGSFIFPVYGTLLGAYREHGFIPYDNDLDVGFIFSNKPDNLPELLKRFGFLHEKQFFFKDENTIIEDVYSYKGVHIDFFAYFKGDKGLYSYITRRHETKHWKEANISDGFPTDYSWVDETEFVETPFLQHTIFMPQKAHQWLEGIYGASFMTPIKHWDKKDYVTRIEPSPKRAYRRYF